MEAALICDQALVVAVLARRRGLELNVDERYHRTPLPFRVRVLQEWEGQSVLGREFKVTADVMPETLIEWATA